MSTNKDRYIINYQRRVIEALQRENARLKQEKKVVIVEKPKEWLPKLYLHYFTVWVKFDDVKVKTNLCACNHKLNYVDSYGWKLVEKYSQYSLVPLDQKRIVVYKRPLGG